MKLNGGNKPLKIPYTLQEELRKYQWVTKQNIVSFRNNFQKTTM